MSRALPVLLSRTADPLLGVFTGLMAFYLHETNPRTAPPQGETLRELVSWKMEKWRKERDEALRAASARDENALLKLLDDDSLAKNS